MRDVHDISGNDALLAEARARDLAAATGLSDMLVASGRGQHPVQPYLALVASEPLAKADLVHIASVAFEAGIRFRLGALAGPDIARTGTSPHVAAFLRRRSAMAWEPAHGIPYDEVDWRAAVASAGRDLAQGKLDIGGDFEHSIPGSVTLHHLIATAPDRDGAIRTLLGEGIRDEVLDPVAANGAFLAQAMPGFIDLDRALRDYRLARLEDQQ